MRNKVYTVLITILISGVLVYFALQDKVVGNCYLHKNGYTVSKVTQIATDNDNDQYVYYEAFDVEVGVIINQREVDDFKEKYVRIIDCKLYNYNKSIVEYVYKQTKILIKINNLLKKIDTVQKN